MASRRKAKRLQYITTGILYSIKGDENMISISYKKIVVDLNPGSTVLCADGTITLTVLSCNTAQDLVRCRCDNSALLWEIIHGYNIMFSFPLPF
jgi:pyruvate kinase